MDNEVLVSLKKFETLMDRYTKQFGEFYNAKTPGVPEESLYAAAHPELTETIKALQIAFCDLPDKLQRRLLEINFNILISYDNDADLYQYRDFVHENDLFHKTLTLTVRVNAEVELAREFIDFDKWDKYDKLPQKEFDSHEKLLAIQ